MSDVYTFMYSPRVKDRFNDLVFEARLVNGRVIKYTSLAMRPAKKIGEYYFSRRNSSVQVVAEVPESEVSQIGLPSYTC